QFEQNFVEFKKHDQYTLLIDSSIFQLLNIENNLQLYAVTKDRNYYSNYIASLVHLYVLIDSLENHLKAYDNPHADELDNLMKQKAGETEVFIFLKTLNDSLINNASLLEPVVDLKDIKINLLPAEINRLESIYF